MVLNKADLAADYRTAVANPAAAAASGYSVQAIERTLQGVVSSAVAADADTAAAAENLVQQQNDTAEANGANVLPNVTQDAESDGSAVDGSDRNSSLADWSGAYFATTTATTTAAATSTSTSKNPAKSLSALVQLWKERLPRAGKMYSVKLTKRE